MCRMVTIGENTELYMWNLLAGYIISFLTTCTPKNLISWDDGYVNKFDFNDYFTMYTYSKSSSCTS